MVPRTHGHGGHARRRVCPGSHGSHGQIPFHPDPFAARYAHRRNGEEEDQVQDV